uniref:Kazal-like domain-containing protein n=1 Tax=Ciona intestinalis TaxID=7719 RepID=H2XKZ0_CIOIN
MMNNKALLLTSVLVLLCILTIPVYSENLTPQQIVKYYTVICNGYCVKNSITKQFIGQCGQMKYHNLCQFCRFEFRCGISSIIG